MHNLLLEADGNSAVHLIPLCGRGMGACMGCKVKKDVKLLSISEIRNTGESKSAVVLHDTLNSKLLTVSLSQEHNSLKYVPTAKQSRKDARER